MGEELSKATANAALVVLTLQRAKKPNAFLSQGAWPSIALRALCVTTHDGSLRRSVVFCDAHLYPTRPDAGRGAKDAEFRDRSASDVCPIATLRGLLL